MYAKTRLWLTGCSLVWSVLCGCTLEKRDEADEFRDAVPEPEAAALSGPDASSSRGTAAAIPGRATLAAAPTLGYAKWYGFTRGMRQGVNVVTASVLGSVWLVLHSVPSELSKDTAVWGPYSDELSPARYRFQVKRVAPDEYEYVLEGQRKEAGADYQAVLAGHGFGRLDARHGQGTFTIDLDAAKALDPFEHAKDSGTVRIDYALPHDFSENPGALPRTISAHVDPEGEAQYSVKSVAELDQTGSIQVSAHVDVEDSKATALEDVLIDSRWLASGAGRADISISGGDLPLGLDAVTAVECWSSAFTQSYYQDSVDLEPTSGDMNACIAAAR